MKVRINEEGYLESLYINNANIEIDVDEDTMAMLSECLNYHNWRFLNDEWQMVCIFPDENLRLMREDECFSYIDRSRLWYDSLSSEQYQELQEWYNAWLNVTETKVIPTKPSWLK